MNMMQIKFYLYDGYGLSKIDNVNNSELKDYLKKMLAEYKCKSIATNWDEDGVCWCVGEGYDVDIVDTDKAVDMIAERVEKFGFCYFGGEFGTYETIRICDNSGEAYCKSIVNKII